MRSRSHISLSSHQLSSNLVIIGEVWNELSTVQQEALWPPPWRRRWSKSRCAPRRPRTRSSLQWGADGAMEIVDDVDRDAFREMAEPYLRENFTPEQVEVLDAIRSTAE